MHDAKATLNGIYMGSLRAARRLSYRFRVWGFYSDHHVPPFPLYTLLAIFPP
jgi:hypothetical protein